MHRYWPAPSPWAIPYDEHRPKATMRRRFLEFFAGDGMARAGLESGWSCLWANDGDANNAEPAGVPWHTQAETQKSRRRFDNAVGDLRTPDGGPSRQILLFVTKNSVRSRWLSPREATRLMGLPDHYQLLSNYNEAYRLTGASIVVPIGYLRGICWSCSWPPRRIPESLNPGLLRVANAQSSA